MTSIALSRLNSGPGRAALIAVRHLGSMGVVAVALMLVSAATAFILTPRLHERSTALDQELRTTASSATTRPARSAVESEAAGFNASLPAIEANAADMNTLFEIAAKNDIKTPKGDYRLSKISGSLFVGYDVRMPVTASYIDLRRFTAQALHQLPNLAVDGVRFSRRDSTTEVLDAELRLVLFYRRQDR